MRAYHETIQVKTGLDGADEGPCQFLWRGRLWLVRDVVTRWVETQDWWNSPAVRAARGDEIVAADADLLGEEEVWRVVAANGRTGTHGVYELSHAWGTGEWQLRTVID